MEIIKLSLGRRRHALLYRSVELQELFMQSQFGDRRYWNTRAETMRALAEDVGDPQAKATLLKVADSYQRLANQADHQSGRLTDAQTG